MIHSRERPDLKEAIEAIHDARKVSDKDVEAIQVEQKNYVERVQTRDVQAHKKAVSIDEEVQRHSEAIHSDDLGFAIDLELELYEQSLGTGIGGAGLGGVDGN